MNKKKLASTLAISAILSMYPAGICSANASQENSGKTLSSQVDNTDGSTVKSSTFDEKEYAKELDTWMQANAPKTQNDLTGFLLKVEAKIVFDGIKYGDKDLVTKQFAAYLLYDIAFVGNSIFAPIFQNTTTLTSMPAPAEGNFPGTVESNDITKDSETGGNIKLHSYYVDQGSDKTVVIHGGYRNSWDNGINTVQNKLFYDRGYNILVVDNRATGSSGGKYITYGKYESDDEVYWINKELTTRPNQKIILYGGSMGAATSMSTLTKIKSPNIKGIVEDCGFAKVYDQLDHTYDMITAAGDSNENIQNVLNSLGLSVQNKDENIQRVDDIYANDWVNLDIHSQLPLDGVSNSNIPKLFIHGEADNFVPTQNVNTLYNAATGYKQLFTVPGAGHGESLTVDPDGYNKNIDKFLDVVFNDRVDVNYVTEDGTKLFNETETGGYGEPYTTKKLNFDGYTFKEIEGNATGTFNDKEQTVSYVYTKNSSNKDSQNTEGGDKYVPTVNDGTKQIVDNKQNSRKHEKTLPETSASALFARNISLIGLVFIINTLALYFGYKSKKNK